MIVTSEWIESIKDEKGLTRGQEQLMSIWKNRLHYVGYGMLPDQVAHVIETCKGYRGMSEELKNLLLF